MRPPRKARLIAPRPAPAAIRKRPAPTISASTQLEQGVGQHARRPPPAPRRPAASAVGDGTGHRDRRRVDVGEADDRAGQHQSRVADARSRRTCTIEDDEPERRPPSAARAAELQRVGVHRQRGGRLRRPAQRRGAGDEPDEERRRPHRVRSARARLGLRTVAANNVRTNSTVDAATAPQASARARAGSLRLARACASVTWVDDTSPPSSPTTASPYWPPTARRAA